MSDYHIVFIGAGRLATNLACALHKAGYSIDCIYSRTETSAKTLAEKVNAQWKTLELCNSVTLELCNSVTLELCNSGTLVIFYALADQALQSVVNQVHAPNAFHFHTAGSMPLSVFGDDKPNAGVFYPYQSFSKDRIVDFRPIPIMIEGKSTEALNIAKNIATTLSEAVYELDSEHRQWLHLAGVFGNNFVNCLYAIAEECLRKANLPFAVLHNQLQETLQKALSMPPREAQTGPAVRGDKAVIDKHLELLQDRPDLQDIYRTITQNIETYAYHKNVQ